MEIQRTKFIKWNPVLIVNANIDGKFTFTWDIIEKVNDSFATLGISGTEVNINFNTYEDVFSQYADSCICYRAMNTEELRQMKDKEKFAKKIGYKMMWKYRQRLIKDLLPKATLKQLDDIYFSLSK